MKKNPDYCTDSWDSELQKNTGFKCDGQERRRVRSSGDPSCTVSEEAKEAAAETGEQVRNLKRRQSAEEGQRKLKDSKGGRGERKTKLRHSQEKKICRKMVWENQKKKDMVIYQFI